MEPINHILIQMNAGAAPNSRSLHQPQGLMYCENSASPGKNVFRAGVYQGDATSAEVAQAWHMSADPCKHEFRAGVQQRSAT